MTLVLLAGIRANIVEQNATVLVVQPGMSRAPVTGDVLLIDAANHVGRVLNGFTYYGRMFTECLMFYF